MKIGILQTGHSPEALLGKHGNYGALFVQLLDGQGFTFDIFDVMNMDFPSGPDVCDGWLITGSRHGVYEDHAFIHPLEDLIRQIMAARKPLVGICFGHQIIAQALGGKVEKFANGWAVGRQTYNWNGDTVALNAWHQDQIVDLPQGATPIASNDHCKYAAVVYDDAAFTIQAHPEFDSAFIKGLADTRGRGVVPDALLDKAYDGLNTPTDNARIAREIGTFLKERRFS